MNLKGYKQVAESETHEKNGIPKLLLGDVSWVLDNGCFGGSGICLALKIVKQNEMGPSLAIRRFWLCLCSTKSPTPGGPHHLRHQKCCRRRSIVLSLPDGTLGSRDTSACFLSYLHVVSTRSAFFKLQPESL
jgi:hypothetical protein